MSCSPTNRLKAISNITTCSECTSSPSQFWCAASNKCYCLNEDTRNACIRLLTASKFGSINYIKPCIVSPTVVPIFDCPPSYVSKCSPSKKVNGVCPPTFSQNIGKCFIPPRYPPITLANIKNPPAQIETPAYKQYLQDVEDYKKTIKREPPPFADSSLSPTEHGNWFITYRDSPYCYDCNTCPTNPYIVPQQCTYGVCMKTPQNNYIMRCVSPTSPPSVCNLNKSYYCMTPTGVWENTSDITKCKTWDTQKMCQTQIPYIISIKGPKQQPVPPGSGIHQLRVKNKNFGLNCPIPKKKKLPIAIIIVSSIVGVGLIVLMLLIYKKNNL